MTKSEYCTQHDPIAYYSGLNGIEIRGIEYGIEDYIYCVSGMMCSKQSFHRCKVNPQKQEIFLSNFLVKGFLYMSV